MKKYRTSRFLSVLLTLCMVLSITAVTASAEEQMFTDVSDDAWYSDAVNFCCNWGLMNGTGDDKFSPNATLTRGMIVTILHRWEGTPDASELDNTFSDVPDDIWYTDAVKWAAANDIVNGYGGDKFGPNDAVTKEQLAVLIFRLGTGYGEIPPEMNEGRDFKDLDSVSEWAAEAVNTLNDRGVFVNLPGDTFNPKAAATRAEVASVIYRYIVVIAAANDGE